MELVSRCGNLCAGAVMLGLCAGCAATSYFHDIVTLPVEAPYRSSGHNSGQVWPHSCFNMTAGDFRAYGYAAERGGPIVALLWLPGLVIDLPISLCADTLSSPWQIARYRSFPQNGLEAFDSSLNRKYYMSRLKPQLLRGLKARQAADGSWPGGQSVLANTALSVLAFLHAGCAEMEFYETWRKGMSYLKQCGTDVDGHVQFQGETDDPRAFLMTACALLELQRIDGSESTCILAEKCLARVMTEDFPCLSGALDETTADQLRWLVMALETPMHDGRTCEGLKTRLAQVRARLTAYEKGDGGYYDSWSEIWRFRYGTNEDFDHWAAGIKERRLRAEASWVSVLADPVEDVSGDLRWAGVVLASEENKRGVRPSGLGEVADTALTILQLSWDDSDRPK